MQLLQTNRRDVTNKLRVENQADSATIYLYDVIDEYYGVSAEEIAKELDALKGKAVTLRINSPGGDVFSGRAMYAAIRQHGDVTAQIDGIAASAATSVAMAAKSISIVAGGFMMIHNAWTFAFGNKNDFMSLADLLDKFDQAIMGDYIKRTGKAVDELTAMMNAETWMNAQEALDMGFVNSVFDGAAAEADRTVSNEWDLSAFNNAPKALTVLSNIGRDQDTERWRQQHAMSERRLRLLNASRY